MFNKFPFTNDHQLNLDWILRILKQLQGGTVDQVLTRKSNKPFDFGWKTMSGGGGGGGTTDYDELGNKPKINNITLEGNKSLLDLGILNRFPGLNLPKMNSSNPSAGSSASYAREDHVHPSDTSRMTSMQVNSQIQGALNYYDPASKTFDPPYSAGTIGKAIEDALAGGVTQEAIQAAVDDYLDDHPALTGMFTNAAKNALISLLEKVAYVDGNGQQYLNELITNLAATVTGISAVFTQGANVVYSTDSLDELKQYLVVTASYSDGTSSEISNYELSGTLDSATSTITASYGGQTDTFTVTVTVIEYPIPNGVHEFTGTSDTDYSQRTIGVTNYKHIVYTNPLADHTKQAGTYAIYDDVSENRATGDNTNVNQAGLGPVFTIPANSTVIFEITNIQKQLCASATRDTFATALRSGNTSIASTGNLTTETSKTVTASIANSTTINCVFVYANAHITRLEFDVSLTVNGEKWI